MDVTKKLEGKPCGTVRDCVSFINKEAIPKEDIVNIFSHEGLIFVIYYK